MASEPEIFSFFRRRMDNRPTRKTDQTEIVFQLFARGPKVYLRVVDPKGKSLQVGYRSYNGWERETLLALEEENQKNIHDFSWGTEGEIEEGFPLNEKSPVIEPLLHCRNLQNDQGETLRIHPFPMECGFRMQRVNEFSWRGEWFLEGTEAPTEPLRDFAFIGDRHLLHGTTIYSTNSLGRRYATAPFFEETIPAGQINPFLSLFASSFPGIPVESEFFTWQETSPVPARPTILFREVDEEAHLHFDLTESIEGLPVEFLRDYELSQSALLDHDENLVRVREIHYGEALESRDALLTMLRRTLRRTKSDKSFLYENEEGGFLLGPDLAETFLTEYLPTLAGTFRIFGAEKLKRYRIVHQKPTLKVRLGNGIDYLDGDADLEIGEEKISLMDALAQYQKNRFLLLSSGEKAVLDEQYIKRLQRLFKKKAKGVRVSFFDLPLVEEMLEEKADREALPPSKEIFSGFNALENRPLRLTRFQGTLRDYQKAGVKWMEYLYENRLGGCLADDMGLGKTIQTIALLSRIYPKVKRPSLLVMPRSLLFNWSRELETFAPHLNFTIHHGVSRDWKKNKKNQIILTTYGTLRSDIKAIQPEKFHTVVLDESQAIKNDQTQTTKAVHLLQADFRLALSGTPVENHLGELFNLFRFLNPAMFPQRAEFDRSYTQPIQSSGDPEAAHELRRKVYPFLLRRLKKQVLKDLPDKVEQVLFVDMNEKQKKHYEKRRRFYQEIVRGEMKKSGLAKSQLVIFEALSELRQIASVPEAKTDGHIPSAKKDRLREALEESISNGHKALVFSNFLAGVDQVSEFLGSHDIPHLRMTGATTDRARLVEQFQKDSSIKVFVMTLKTGGLGLNLTAADTIYILDPWWNTAAESQAVDRAHRIGQKQTVFTFRLIARNTIEEKILELQKRKQNLVDQVVASDQSAFKNLSEDDVEHLFEA
ncbi:MAG: DEAD/DEAH box helicase family protein [Opitutales bacterium]|nr:DEAD/DEAH box helicase family protein [Opitutales bacterium]MCH8539652.1 DEAD/DEAH box helicase [Opitutales bacterium]